MTAAWVLAELAAAAAICGWHAVRWHIGATPHAHWLAGRTTPAQRWSARAAAAVADLALGWAWLAGQHLLVLAVTTASLAALAVTYTAVPKGHDHGTDDLLPPVPHAHGL